MSIRPPMRWCPRSMKEAKSRRSTERGPERAGNVRGDRSTRSSSISYMPSRSNCPRASSCICRHRQLRHPQAPQGAGVADAAPALDPPLHAYVVLLAQRCRGTFHQVDQAKAEARRVPLLRLPQGRCQTLRGRHQRQPRPFPLDRDPDTFLGAVRRRHQALDLVHQSLGTELDTFATIFDLLGGECLWNKDSMDPASSRDDADQHRRTYGKCKHYTELHNLSLDPRAC